LTSVSEPASEKLANEIAIVNYEFGLDQHEEIFVPPPFYEESTTVAIVPYKNFKNPLNPFPYGVYYRVK
jgi:hypothetical protein